MHVVSAAAIVSAVVNVGSTVVGRILVLLISVIASRDMTMTACQYVDLQNGFSGVSCKLSHLGIKTQKDEVLL